MVIKHLFKYEMLIIRAIKFYYPICTNEYKIIRTKHNINYLNMDVKIKNPLERFYLTAQEVLFYNITQLFRFFYCLRSHKMLY